MSGHCEKHNRTYLGTFCPDCAIDKMEHLSICYICKLKRKEEYVKPVCMTCYWLDKDRLADLLNALSIVETKISSDFDMHNEKGLTFLELINENLKTFKIKGNSWEVKDE